MPTRRRRRSPPTICAFRPGCHRRSSAPREGQMARPTAARTLLVALAFAPLWGCATAPGICFGRKGLQSVSLYSTPATNGGAPVAVDLVYVTQKAAAQAIAKLSASDYYGSNARRQL